jgi:hypothetical protein
VDQIVLALNSITGLVELVCCIMVIVKVFQSGQTGLGIGLTFLTCPCLIGGLITFIYGWVKAGEWKITNLMLVWTGAFVINVITGIMAQQAMMAQLKSMGLPVGG